MFSYFGSKSTLAQRYPRPAYEVIVEPFAGSAGYAMHSDYWTRDVVLVERHPQIAALWLWLIEEASYEAVMALPDMTKGADLNSFGPLGSPSRTLANLAQASADWNKHQASEWQAANWPGMRHRVASSLHKAKHWTLIEGDYTDAPDIEATWFVDPPYQLVEWGYESDRQALDFTALGQWCQSRKGQTIVCEQMGADWLPFEPFAQLSTINDTSTIEAVWYSEPEPTLLSFIE